MNKEKKYIPIEERSEKELQISIANYLFSAHKSLNRIEKNVQFFFWVTIISIVIGILIFIKS